MICVVVYGSNPEVDMSKGNGTSHAEPKIGRTLELAREERGLSLHQAEQETKIRARYLRELERENFDVLPPVYVQGSLKTYANFLGLDGDALTRELKRRQPLEDELPEAQTHVEPPKSDYFERYLISVGGATGADEHKEVDEEEEIAGAAAVPAGNRRLYLGSAAFLVLGAIAIALTLPRGGQPAVSEVREPLISQAPSEVSRAGGEENEPASRTEANASDNPRPEQRASSPDTDTGDDGEPAQDPPDATAAPSAPPVAETAAAEPEATPSPTTNEPAPTQPSPAASEAPVREIQGSAGGLRVERPIQQDEGPVKNFSITKNNVTIGGHSSPGGTRTSDSCSRDDDRLDLRWGKKGGKVCLTDR
jgi:cytoskeletal protein RodZ